ncbi:hypothetical protein LCGC14_2114410, partial [marine sediment metagenome]
PMLDKELEDLERSHKELTVLAQEYLKEMGGCDHSVGICSCVDQAKLRFALQVRARIDKVPWCVNCGTEGGHTIKDCPYEVGREELEGEAR